MKLVSKSTVQKKVYILREIRPWKLVYSKTISHFMTSFILLLDRETSSCIWVVCLCM